ncbi:NAD kinase [Gordonia sp. (in: high G+C Gram-positive bacteria)]|uniref:NAD kinase n=1 Tax=Gordonia sp. (in: high G+C Gram-positive bacteria) TaxID=84139 RepID=UPI00169B5250|nr:NAD kinase [Gordonia sp. (in: high G+C Gram-positive bacteria)]NLG48093.1 NAD kinase [Gordonia sp. (in: high G+C Gram-positive bacteria)]
MGQRQPVPNDRRTFLVVAHTGRDEVTTTLITIARRCGEAGIALRVVDHDTRRPAAPYVQTHPIDPQMLRDAGAEVEVTHADSASAQGCELVLVLGGDGTFLRAAELAYPAGVPLMGINLGHIGFLAEAEAHRIDEVLDRLIGGEYRVVDRMVLDVAVIDPGSVEPRARDWVLNEVVIQNTSHNGVLEIVTEVDGRPVAAYGADGILVATPTGSTAYAFSAGGPVMWPDLEAILVVPSNAHALFARPMVTSPRSRVAVEVHREGRDGVALCDGRRMLDVPAGSRVEVVRAQRSLRWVRIDSEPFADRLVTKFSLPVTGWRGRS